MKENSLLHRLIEPFLHSEIATFSAASCLYIAVSIIPSSSILLRLIYHFPMLADLISAGTRNIVPSVIKPILSEAIASLQKHASYFPMPIVGVLTVWSASRGLNSIFDGLTKIYHLTDVSYFRRRFIGIIRYYFLLLLLSLIGIFQIILSASYSETLHPVLTGLLLLVPIFAVIYWIPCIKEIRFRICFLGSTFCVIAWMFLFLFFSIYLKARSNMYSIYHIVMICLWAYFSLIIFFTGGILVREAALGTYKPIKQIRLAIQNRRK